MSGSNIERFSLAAEEYNGADVSSTGCVANTPAELMTVLFRWVGNVLELVL